MKTLKIGLIAPVAERVPPKKYGGTERVVSAIAEELVQRGHDVTLFASGDSVTSAKLESVSPQGLREMKITDAYGVNIPTLLNVGLAYSRQVEFDILHDNVNPFSIPAAVIAKTPVVMTMHGVFTEINHDLYNLPGLNIVSISDSQRRFAPDLNYLETVYNGLEMEHYPFSATHDNYLIFVGRISPEKGTHYAIQVAQKLGMPLIIAAKLDSVHRDYYRRKVKPHLSETIKWIGEVGEEERNQLFSRAYASLHPVVFPEPFGLVLIESGACGTPVVAFNQGAIPEVIQDGQTGFVVNTVDEMVEAVKKVNTIDRAFCRKYVLENFSAKRMVDEYLKVYEKLLDKK
jgi:glycosyltransferase involved in cell wall biosynthesis